MDNFSNNIKRYTIDGVAPEIGHYRHVLELPNGMIYISGQKAWSLESGDKVEGNISQQVDKIFENLTVILSSIGLNFDSITRVSCFLSDVDSYDEFNTAYALNLGNSKPSRTVIGGNSLRGGALVELVFEAYRST